jgi:hypothetical protein
MAAIVQLGIDELKVLRTNTSVSEYRYAAKNVGMPMLALLYEAAELVEKEKIRTEFAYPFKGKDVPERIVFEPDRVIENYAKDTRADKVTTINLLRKPVEYLHNRFRQIDPMGDEIEIDTRTADSTLASIRRDFGAKIGNIGLMLRLYEMTHNVLEVQDGHS